MSNINITEDDGIFTTDVNANVRVRVVQDEDPHTPETDVPTARIDGGHVEYLAGKDVSEVDTRQLLGAWNTLGDWDKIGRWLRMFHGATAVEIIDSRDGTFVMFDTPKWRKYNGISETVSLTGEAADWRAWLDGEVYGVIVERTTTTKTTSIDMATGDMVSQDENDGWREIGSTWGFFGREDAEESAREELTFYVTEGAEMIGIDR